MNTTVSRFSVLRIEDDEDEKAAQRARDRQRAAEMKAAAAKKNDGKSKQTTEKIAAKKVKISKERAELKALAFGGSKKHQKLSHNVTKQNVKPKSAPNTNSREASEVPSDWKQRDEDFVEDVYEKQLREALLASKLDYEEKKDVYMALEKEAKDKEKIARKKQGNKKGVTLSIDEFNLQLSQEALVNQPVADEQINSNLNDESFFDKITEEAKKISSYEKVKNEISSKNRKKLQKALEISDVPRLAQMEQDLKQAEEEIANLRQENEKLKEELLAVKSRSKRLCNILAQGEMREKAELLVEMEKLATVKDELTAEVENLLSQLHQERSKKSALSEAKRTSNQKKRQDSMDK